MYHVVSFPPTSSSPENVEMIHELWVLPDRKKCFFPPFMPGQYKKALKMGMIPGSSWKTYNMRIIHSYDSYEKAYEWLSVAELLSDFETEDNMDVEVKRKQKRTKKRKLNNSSDDEEDSPNLPLRPSISNCNSRSIITESRANISKLNCVVKCEVFEEESSEEESCATVNEKTSTNEASTTENPQVQATSFEEKVLRWMEETDKKLEENNKLLSNILLHLQENNPFIHVTDEQIPKLPVKSLIEFKELESFIENTENFSNLVKYLSRKGGDDVNEATKRVLKSIMQYQLATEFNWAGRGEKQAFKDTKIKLLIIGAVRENTVYQNASEKDIEEAIKSFLKYSPLRVKYQNNKSMT